MGKYTVTSGQNIYDVALHLYGSIEGITDLMICNPELSLDETLHSGQELLYSDDTVIDADVVAWFRNNGVTPSGGERNIYPKTFTLPLKAEIQLDPEHTGTGMMLSARQIVDMEIDWGDNSPAEHRHFKDPQHIAHRFDNTVTGVRKVRLYGEPALHTLDLTELRPKALYLFHRFPVEEFALRDARLDISFVSLLEGVRTIDLSGTVTASLQPLLTCKSLMEVDLRTATLYREVVDGYLVSLVERYYGRRSCTVRLLTEPSGEYREPARDENGRYRIFTGMEAVWVLTHEESWNQAGAWRIVIGEKEYTYEPAGRESEE